MLPLQGKVIDFVAFLAPTAATKAAFRRLASETERHGRDFNHILHTPTCDLPIALSIETKTAGEGNARAHVQLDVWVHGHMQRLEELVARNSDERGGHKVTIPSLPLILVQGAVWHFLLARREEEDGLVQTRIYEEVTIGDATKVSGLLRILTALLMLLEWADEKFRPWFEEYVCGRASVAVKQGATAHHD
jgi:hypothetical protein